MLWASKPSHGTPSHRAPGRGTGRGTGGDVAAAVVVCALLLGSSLDTQAGHAVEIPLSCTHGGGDQRVALSPSVPRTVAEGSTFTVRIDGQGSGEISHVGLRHIRDMTTEMIIPSGASLVPGSAHIVAGTGTANVRAGARVTGQAGVVRMVLPAQIEKGSSYTPPSFEFSLKATAPAGAQIVQKFSRYEVTASAVLIGDVHTVCEPTPKPYPIATTTVTAAPPDSLPQ